VTIEPFENVIDPETLYPRLISAALSPEPLENIFSFLSHVGLLMDSDIISVITVGITGAAAAASHR
jgi:hypothetical protein